MRLTNARSAPLHLSFEGQIIPAGPGETVAAALIAAGFSTFRRTHSGAPRGVHCGMGACFDCIVTIDGQPGQRACLTPATHGMCIGYDTVASGLSASSGALPERLLTPQILVVGAGPAGLAAAVAAATAGADVLLLDERSSPGGQYFKPAAVPDAQSRRGDALRARAAGIPTFQAAVWGAFPGPEITAVTPEIRLRIRSSQLVLATGAHEAPVHLPGWTLPGCITTGALQGLVRTHRVSPGQRVVVAGNGPLNLQVAAELVRAGGTVGAVLEAAVRPTGLAMALASPALAWAGQRILTTLRQAGVPILWQTRPTALLGATRVEALRLAGPHGERVLPADAVALNWGFQAETGLARALGAAHHLVNGRLETITDIDGRTSLPGLFAVGDGARMGGAQVALHRGRATGLAAARATHRLAPCAPYAALRRAERFQRALWHAFDAPPPDPVHLPDHVIVCRCEEVSAGTLRSALQAGAGSLPTLKRATRAGMGPCAGRFCGAAISRLAGAIAESGFAAPRLPLRPVLAGLILADHPEPADADIPDPAPTRWITTASTPLPPRADVVVIGAGIIGLAVALYLAQDGIDVLLLDRAEPGMAASTANAGSLHIQLVPYVYAAGTGGPMADALSLGPASVTLWQQLARDINEDLGLRIEGGLVLAETEAELVILRAKTAFERARGIKAEVIGPADLRHIAPALDNRFAGAAFCPSEGQGDPLRGTMALLAQARRAGVRFAQGQQVTGIEPAGTGWTVRTASGLIAAGQVVNAAGVQAGRIARLAGTAVPVHALVQQVIATAAAPPLLRQLVAWTGRHLSLKQGNAGHLVLGGGWPGTYDDHGAAQLRRESIEGNLALACHALPALRAVHVLRAWTALAPHLARGPVISATPGAPGLWHGVTGNGYTLGPIVGRILADAVQGRTAPPPAFSL